MIRSETTKLQCSWRQKPINFPKTAIRSSFAHWPRLTRKPVNSRKRSKLRDAHRSRPELRACTISLSKSRRRSIFISVARPSAIPACEMRNKISERWLVAGICAGLVALVWLAFGQSSQFPFVNYDDANYVTENPAVIHGLSWDGIIWAFSHVHGGNWHPLTTISHMFDCGVFGLRAGAHHLNNVLLHTWTTIALFLVLRRLTGALWRSAFVAAVFAIHPLRVESVVWIAERKDVLSGFFFMLTLAAYLHYARKPSIWRYLTMSILFACGLMSKPMLVSLPIILLLLDYWPLDRGQRTEHRGQTKTEVWRKLVAEKIPLFLLSIASAVATLIAQKQAIGSFEKLPLSVRVSQALDRKSTRLNSSHTVISYAV